VLHGNLGENAVTKFGGKVPYGLWGPSVLSAPLSVMKAISKLDVPTAVYTI